MAALLRAASVRRSATSVLLAASLASLACAGPRPVLYPNVRLQETGEAAADQAVEECMELADARGIGDNAAADTAVSTGAGAAVGGAVGAVTGAITGSPGTGAAAGAAGGGVIGLFRGLFGARDPGPVYKNYVNACLRERGYQPLGWD